MGEWDWKDEKVKRAVEKLFRQNLCAKKEDKVLIVSDAYKERIGELFFWYGTSVVPAVSHVTYAPTGRHGLEPPEEVWRATFGAEFVEELRNKGLLEKVLSNSLPKATRER